MPDAVEIDMTDVTRFAGELGKAAVGVEAAAAVVVERNTERVAQLARDNAPVNTGHLQDSIGYEMESPLVGVAGPTVFYGRFVEDGTSKMAPESFMGPAADVVEPDFADELSATGDLTATIGRAPGKTGSR